MGEIVILSKNPADKLAARLLIAGYQDFPGTENRERERKRRRGEHPYIYRHPGNLLQFLFKRQLVPKRVGRPGAAVREEDSDIDIAEGTCTKEPYTYAKRISFFSPPVERRGGHGGPVSLPGGRGSGGVSLERDRRRRIKTLCRRGGTPRRTYIPGATGVC